MELLTVQRYNKSFQQELEYAFLNIFEDSELEDLRETKIDAPSYVGFGRDGRIKAFILVTKSEYCLLEKGQYYISYLGVLPRYQNLGYAAKLVDMVKKYAKEIYLNVTNDNERANRFYSKMQFTEIKRYKTINGKNTYGITYRWLKQKDTFDRIKKIFSK
jgi:ribosomal protein S18 acetylase RimI-like enzyme